MYDWDVVAVVIVLVRRFWSFWWLYCGCVMLASVLCAGFQCVYM